MEDTNCAENTARRKKPHIAAHLSLISQEETTANSPDWNDPGNKQLIKKECLLMKKKDHIKDLQSTSATEHAATSDVSGKPQSFKVTLPTIRPKYTTIQFKVKIEEIELIKKSFGRTWMSNKEAGERIFKYYLYRECP